MHVAEYMSIKVTGMNLGSIRERITLDLSSLLLFLVEMDG